jgi:hypothetical protein
MAKVLKKIFIPTTDEIVQNFPIESWHVSQSVDAFTGTEAYDILLSGSLTVTGSVAINGLSDTLQNNVLTYDDLTGLIYYTSSNTFAVNNFYTSSVTQSITSSVVNNTINQSTINQTIISSSVNNVAPSDKYIQYNSGSTFGADVALQWIYNLSSLQHGDNTSATAIFSHSEGQDTVASGNVSHAEGSSTISQGAASHAEGQDTVASGDGSHAEGLTTTAMGNYSHTEGFTTSATGIYSHAEGENTNVRGTSAHAEGLSTTAAGYASHAEGYNTTAEETGSHAEGGSTSAQGLYSHAEGFGTVALGLGSHAEGSGTKAQGQYSHAEGFSTLALGGFSHTEGYFTTSSVNANYAHAEGWGTVADANYQHVMGAYNRSSSNASAFIIGNGASNSSRSNLVYASGSSFQITGSLNLSGSFAPQFRDLGSANTTFAGSVPILSTDYNVVFSAGPPTPPNFTNRLRLPSSPPKGTVIYLQRISGTNNCQVIASGDINGSSVYVFPTTLYTRRMFVFDGANWFVEV